MGNTVNLALTPVELAVHPHACGEHSRINRWFRVRSGSSPRLWGTHGVKCLHLPNQRFIPTPVGNTISCGCSRSHMAVHPHACGEHVQSASDARSVSGSSPRLWGTQQRGGYGGKNCRFIPTPVGNTDIVSHHAAPISVHPHACGEHSQPKGHTAYVGGSSPRLWGTHDPTRVLPTARRFIPTPVGNTTPGMGAVTEGAVHPHACGEHMNSASP